ncbi:hypothetical protein OHA18_42170 [Kribbella sp. NBC_00709]|uniref:hypothetical protein n=1 Tax=Kribbella sp. NBC_00709 TaxID=2975972 RepID=UPI002E28372F|nr:hypothetical protein [Kribbella sp. NBC_00709]
MTRRIPRRLARSPIPLFRAGLVIVSGYASGEAPARTLDLPDLAGDGPLPADMAMRLPLVRIEFGD